MSDLLINAFAAHATSLGVRKYYRGIVDRLNWPVVPRMYGKSIGFGDRIVELLLPGRTDAILWSPSHRGPLFARNHVVTVHDCINIDFTYRHDRRLPLLKASFAQLVGNAVRVITNSQTTREEVLAHFKVAPTRVVAIPGPASFPGKTQQLRVDAAASDSVLMIANALPHKNTKLAGQAFARSDAARSGARLVVVGSFDENGLKACRDAGVRIEIKRGLSDAEVEHQLLTCRFLWTTSLQEGLNLPVAEALSCGVNVLASDIPVHRELYEGEAVFFDPVDIDSATAALDRMFNRNEPWPTVTKDKSGLTFDSVAERYREMFLELADRL